MNGWCSREQGGSIAICRLRRARAPIEAHFRAGKGVAPNHALLELVVVIGETVVMVVGDTNLNGKHLVLSGKNANSNRTTTV